MKKLSICLLSLFITLTLSAQSIASKGLIGKWKGEDGGEVGIIHFDKEGYVSFTVGGEMVGGQNYEAEGMVFDMFYEVDDSIVPNKIDFVIRMDDGETEVARMLGIYALVDKKTLVIHMKFDGTERPDVLDKNSEDQITLKKMKK
jgi:hypothetical protein